MKGSTANLIGFGSLIVSLIALVVAFQANQFSRESNEIARSASKANIEIFDDGRDYLSLIYTDICYLEGSFTPYRVERTASRNFTITNRGGLNASLVEVKLFEGDDEFHLSRIHEGNLPKLDEDYLELPVDIPPGAARTFSTKTEYHDSYEDRSEAIESARIHYDGMKFPVKWVLKFSDGTVITKTVDDYTYHHWDIESTVDDSCVP